MCDRIRKSDWRLHTASASQWDGLPSRGRTTGSLPLLNQFILLTKKADILAKMISAQTLFLFHKDGWGIPMENLFWFCSNLVIDNKSKWITIASLNQNNRKLASNWHNSLACNLVFDQRQIFLIHVETEWTNHMVLKSMPDIHAAINDLNGRE